MQKETTGTRDMVKNMQENKGRIFYDVDTQSDFMNADGALAVPGASTIKGALCALTVYATAAEISVFGSVDRHFGTPEYKAREGELKRHDGPFPDHCMDGTCGQRKIDETTRRINNVEHSLYLPHLLPEATSERLEKIAHHAFTLNIPLYLEKQSYDVFTNPLAEVLLREAGVNEAIVYGVATDFCVRAAVTGMQQRGIQCYVVQNAIAGVFPETSAAALREMKQAGARFVTTADVLEGRI